MSSRTPHSAGCLTVSGSVRGVINEIAVANASNAVSLRSQVEPGNLEYFDRVNRFRSRR